MSETDRPGIAIVGAGAWGKNLVRNFAALSSCRLVALCDRDPGVLDPYRESFPQVIKTGDVQEILGREDVHRVVVASQAATHAALGVQALKAGQRVNQDWPDVKARLAERKGER